MQPINPGLIVPLYTSSEATLQTVHDGYGILASTTNFIPWSLSLPLVIDEFNPRPAPVVLKSWLLRPLNGGADIPMPDSLITLANSSNREWAYFNGEIIPGGVPCGEYEIVFTWYDVEYFSDAITVMDVANVTEKTRSVYKLTSSSSQNHNNILYASGYKQVFYFLGQFGPVFDDEPELLDNGDGVQYIAHAQVRDRLAFTATNVPDSAVSGLYEAKYHNVRIERVAGGSAVTSNRYDLAVSPVEDRNNVTITVERAVYITKYCEPTITLI